MLYIAIYLQKNNSLMKELAVFKLEPEMLATLKQIAREQNRSFSNLMETIVIEFLSKQEGGK